MHGTYSMKAGDMEAAYDVLVIGGGPAGLSAALSLARYDRRVMLFDAGEGRSSSPQINHNYLGFPGGVAAPTLRALGRQQLSDYPQVTLCDQHVDGLERAAAAFVAHGQVDRWCGRAVILCMGVTDDYACFAGWEACLGRSLFWCLTCDGYESKGARVVVLGHTNTAAVEALQLQRFTDHLTLLTHHDTCAIDAAHQAHLQGAGIALLHDRIAAVRCADGQLEALWTAGGCRLPLDRLFCMPQMTPCTSLARALGVALDAQGYIRADTAQKTNMPGVFAAGDVTRLFSHQLSTAVHEGATAATAANQYLYPPALQGT
jgi:thioredoxin reductase (NADPH)